MSGRFLLDTSIVIALFADDLSVQEHLRKAEEVFVPSIVLGELYFGVRKSGRVQQNLKRIIISFNRENARYRYFNQKRFARKNQA